MVCNLMLLGWMPSADWALGVTIAVGSLFMGAANVLFYELAVEVRSMRLLVFCLTFGFFSPQISFPAGEGLIGCVVTVLNNAFGAAMYPMQIGIKNPLVIMWINAGNSLFFGLAMLFLKESYNRYDLDEQGKKGEVISETSLLLPNIQDAKKLE